MAPSITMSSQGGMFHTFQGVTPRKPSKDLQNSTRANSNGTAKRDVTPHACAECKRRKIRCDGQKPCGQCMSSRAPKQCFYDKPRRRVIPSRKILEKLSQSLAECQSILKRLFPSQDVQSLLPLSRQELLVLLQHQNADLDASSLPSPPSPPASISLTCDEASLCRLEQIPTRDTEWDEERRGKDAIPAEADDVNALSLAVDRQASYLGVSSIKAALVVMRKVQPALNNYFASTNNNSSDEMLRPMAAAEQQSGATAAAAAAAAARKNAWCISWSSKGQAMIDAYFKRIHVFTPMLDEAAFRDSYFHSQRSDLPWLSLLNMVFAMGSVVGTKSDDTNHFTYYRRALDCLSMDSFGSSHIETVQALAIMGGHYLHYINRPNMANAILGAAIRMASALGLHREILVKGGTTDIATAETRRRTWWSLFCLDTWATTTTGRPSFGRCGPAINIQPPDLGIGGDRDSAEHAGILPLIKSIEFCKISTQIQDMLAMSPLLSADDRCSLDAKLVDWYQTLPWLLGTTEPCAEPLYIYRCVTKWRYQNLRMLLHRPVLLDLASSGQEHAAPKAKVAAVDTCRELAKQTIEDIAREWSRNQMLGWNAVWFLYQAVMVPLVSIFWQWASPLVPEWHNQIESVLRLLEAMEEWSLAAKRSREAVWRMYEASRQQSKMRPQALVEQQQLYLDGASASVQQNELVQSTATTAIGDVNLHMSPIGFLSGADMLNLLDQQELWSPGGMYWPQTEEDGFTAAAAMATATAAAAPYHNVYDAMIPMNCSMEDNPAADTFSSLYNDEYFPAF